MWKHSIRNDKRNWNERITLRWLLCYPDNACLRGIQRYEGQGQVRQIGEHTEYELDGRIIKISQALNAEERFDKKRLGYIKYAVNKSTGIKLHWIQMNLEKRSVTVYGQCAARIESNGFLKHYIQTRRCRRSSTKSHGQMVDKKLVATTVSSRETGMQRRINQGTTSSHNEQNDRQEEKKNERNSCLLPKERTARRYPFPESREKAKKKWKKVQQQALGTQCHRMTEKRKQQRTEASTPNQLVMKATAAAAKPNLRIEMKDRKERRHLLCYKRTQDRWIRVNGWRKCSVNYTRSIGMLYSYPRHGAKTKRYGRRSKVTSWLSRGSSPTNTELRSCWTGDGRTGWTGYNVHVSVWLHVDLGQQTCWWECTCPTMVTQIITLRKSTKRS